MLHSRNKQSGKKSQIKNHANRGRGGPSADDSCSFASFKNAEKQNLHLEGRNLILKNTDNLDRMIMIGE